MTSSVPGSILPPLAADEEQHSRAVALLLREQIAASGGWLSFERFMELALYTPGLGYYSAGSVKIGAGGDFVTAPEISDLFSRCVARQCAEVLAQTGGDVLELGAGTGRMAATVLESLAAAGVLPERYAILEVSADLAERQRTRLQGLPRELRQRVVWLERLPERPIRGVLLANEVLDALPCRRFTLRSGAVRELGVALGANTFHEREAPPDAALARACDAVICELPASLPDGYISELCLRVEPWIAGVGQCLERGVLLLFDYGLPRAQYYSVERTRGTLLCHYRHRFHDDVFANIGLQDIGAWVDFTS